MMEEFVKKMLMVVHQYLALRDKHVQIIQYQWLVLYVLALMDMSPLKIPNVSVRTIYASSRSVEQLKYILTVDIDECDNPADNNCTELQSCVNTPGSFMCFCQPGYRFSQTSPLLCEGKAFISTKCMIKE